MLLKYYVKNKAMVQKYYGNFMERENGAKITGRSAPFIKHEMEKKAHLDF